MTEAEHPRSEGQLFRTLLGVVCVAGGLAGFGGLYFLEIPPGNRDAMMLALGIILGWGSAVVQSEYGASVTGRKVAESAVRHIERQNLVEPVPESAEEAAQDTADAAQKKADTIKGAAPKDKFTPPPGEQL